MFRVLITVFVCAVVSAGCNAAIKSKPETVIVIDVTGDNFNWHFRYPGQDGVLGTDDDARSVQTLYLPENTDVKLQLHSKDYLYSFALPDFSQKAIAVPDLDFDMTFATGGRANYALVGDQFCGFSHDSLMGRADVSAQNNSYFGRE